MWICASASSITIYATSTLNYIRPSSSSNAAAGQRRGASHTRSRGARGGASGAAEAAAQQRWRWSWLAVGASAEGEGERERALCLPPLPRSLLLLLLGSARSQVSSPAPRSPLLSFSWCSLWSSLRLGSSRTENGERRRERERGYEVMLRARLGVEQHRRHDEHDSETRDLRCSLRLTILGLG